MTPVPPDDVTLPCGHGATPTHERGERFIRCGVCGVGFVVAAIPAVLTLYDIVEAKP